MSLWQREKEHVQHVPLTGTLEVFILILLILEIVKGVIGV